MSGATTQAHRPVACSAFRCRSAESYQDASLPMSAKRLLNLYAGETPADARAPFKLALTPGLIDLGWGAVGTGPVTAINGDSPAEIYVVSWITSIRLGQPVLYGPLVIEDLWACRPPVRPGLHSEPDADDRAGR